MDQCSIYQMSDDISYSNQAPATPHILASSHHYKHEILQPSNHHQAAAAAALRFQSQQIQNSNNYHILSRHYLGQAQHQQHQQQQFHHYQLHQHSSTRQHLNISSSMPLNSSKLIWLAHTHWVSDTINIIMSKIDWKKNLSFFD